MIVIRRASGPGRWRSSVWLGDFSHLWGAGGGSLKLVSCTLLALPSHWFTSVFRACVFDAFLVPFFVNFGTPEGPPNQSKSVSGARRWCPGEAWTLFFVNFEARRRWKSIFGPLLERFWTFFPMSFLTNLTSNRKTKKCIWTCKTRYNMKVTPSKKGKKNI